MDHMSETHDLRARLEALEAEVERLRREAAATRALGATAGHGGEDRSVRREQRQPLTKLAEAVGVLITGPAGPAPVSGGLPDGCTAPHEEPGRLPGRD